VAYYMNLQHVRVLTQHALHRSLRSASGILFLVLYGIIWFMIFRGMAGGYANELANPEANAIASWLTSPELARSLFVNHPPTLGFFFLVALFVTPGFVMWGAGDQTASDIGNRYLRFLIPRCGRYEIYLGRFLGAVIFTVLVQILIVVVAVVIAIFTDNVATGEILSYAVRILLALLFYTLPYVALMAALAALTGSVAIAILTATASYAVIATITGLISMRWPWVELIGWLMPSALKNALLIGDSGSFIMALCLLLVYTAVYLVCGWYIFRQRDI